MKYYLIISLLFLLLVGCSKKSSNPVESNPPAPAITFTKTFGSLNDDWGNSVQQTSDNGFIIAGETWSFGAGQGDVYLIRTDARGNKIWEKTFGGTGYDGGSSIQQTSDGGFIISGFTNSFGGGDFDLYLIRIDSCGNKIWEKIFGGNDKEWGNFAQQTPDGGFIIVGYTKSFGSGNGDIYLVKTDANGNKIWEKTFGGINSDWGNSIQTTSDGGFIITGYTWSFGSGRADVYLIRTDASGNKMWEKVFGGIRDDWGNSVQQTSDGGFIVVGYTGSLGSYDYDVYLIKTDASGNKVWQKIFGGSGDDWGNSIQQTSDGGFVICGVTQVGQIDVYVIKTDESGNKLWEKTFGGVYSDWGNSVCQTSDKGFVIAGVTSYPSAGGWDIYLIKTDSEGNVK